MAQFVWTGTVSNNPTVGANWNVGGVAQAAPPTAADDVAFGTGTGATNNACTIPTATTIVGRSFDFTGYTGTFTFASTTAIMTIGDATAGAGNIALKFVSGMTLTLTGRGTINFISTSATQQTITTGGKVLPNLTFNGAGISLLLTDNLTALVAVLNHTQGTFDTGSKSIVAGQLNTNNANTRVLTLGSSAITLTTAADSVAASSITGLTVTTNTAVITLTAANANLRTSALAWNGTSFVFSGGGTTMTLNKGGGAPTMANLTVVAVNATDSFNIGASGSFTTVTGLLTLTGFNSGNPLLVISNTPGTRTKLSAGSISLTNVSFQDTDADGAAIPWTGTNLVDAGNNLDITFAGVVVNSNFFRFL